MKIQQWRQFRPNSSDQSNETSSAVLSHGTIYFDRSSNFLSLCMKSYDVTIQMKPLQQYFHMVLFI